MQQFPPSYQKPSSDLIYHIYRGGLFSRDARITVENKQEQLFHVEFPLSLFGSWSVTIHWGANKNGPIAMTISKPIFSWDFDIIDHTTNFRTSLIKTGFFSRKHSFMGPDGRQYAWKGSGFGGNLKLVAYPEKVQVGYYERAMFSFMKEGKLVISPQVHHMINLIIATGFAVEEWEREQRNS
ncbi:hypothetical protein HK103_004550 [Boothiomyces macroporosus]|uniref:DUF6593 domain-containing protein n=1 Tax=Boothiomyces macroporosus TaxID=261099 RepID=A0AAD5Y880_9FUNG|nr:hypothetical protein HK103_004550 [Boothiomyces macroporosus]